MRVASGVLVGGWLALLLLGGCANILGLDEYTPETGGTGGSDPMLSPLGDPCESGATCESGLCVDEVCCDDACSAICAACNLAGEEGTCTNLPAASGNVACSGVCDGDGGCVTAGADAVLFGGMGEGQAFGVAAKPGGGFVMTGRYTGDLAFPVDPLPVVGGWDGFVASLDEDAEVQWARYVGGTTNDELRAVAVSDTGQVVAAGYGQGMVNFGTNVLGLDAFGDPLIVAWGPTGTEAWSATVSPTPNALEIATDVAIDDEGKAWVTGWVADGGMAMTGLDGFVAIFDVDGTMVGEVINFGSPDLVDATRAVAAAPELKRVVVAGSAEGPLNVLNAEGSGATPGGDLFLAMFDSGGGLLWAKAFASVTGFAVPTSVALDEEGGVIVVGHMTGTHDFGGAPLQAGQDDDIFLASFDADGNHRFSQVYPAPQPQFAEGIAVDAGGRLVMAGALQVGVQLGPNADSLFAVGGNDAFVGRFTPAGQHLTSFSFGDPFEQFLRDVAVEEDGTVRLVGFLQGTVSAFGQTLTASNGSDALVVTLPP